MKHSKFKYISFKFSKSYEDLIEDFKVVDNPFEFNRELPDGEYLVKLPNKRHIEYWKSGKHWFLVDDRSHSKDKSYQDCINARYMIFPVIKHTEYLKLLSVYDKLSNQWKRNVRAYFYWLEFRATYRNVLKTIFEKNETIN
jgi:hypothetical protein